MDLCIKGGRKLLTMQRLSFLTPTAILAFSSESVFAIYKQTQFTKFTKKMKS